MPTWTTTCAFSPPPGIIVARISHIASDIRWNTRPRCVCAFQSASIGAAPYAVRIPPPRASTPVWSGCHAPRLSFIHVLACV